MATSVSENKSEEFSHQRENATGRREEKDRRHYETQENFLRKELEKVKEKNEKYNSNLIQPEQEPFVPFVFNSLKPYTDTRMIETAINEPPETQHHPVSRNTALGHCDPWISLEMDNVILPTVPSTARDSSKYGRGKSERDKTTTSRSLKKEEDKEDGHVTPPVSTTDQFPTVTPRPSQFHGKALHFDQVPQLRNELRRSYSSEAERKIEMDYQKTKKFFYSRQLDRMEEYRENSRQRMRATYFAYLQNNPGSKKAVHECIRKSEQREEKKKKKDKDKDMRTDKDRHQTGGDLQSNSGDKNRQTNNKNEDRKQSKNKKEE